MDMFPTVMDGIISIYVFSFFGFLVIRGVVYSDLKRFGVRINGRKYLSHALLIAVLPVVNTLAILLSVVTVVADYSDASGMGDYFKK